MNTNASPDNDHLVVFEAALADLQRTAELNIATGTLMQERIEWFRRQLASGRSIVEAVQDEDSPPLVELVTHNMDRLHTVGARYRAAQAHALREEGLTMAAIAQLFGLTRQRISALLRQKSAPGH